VRSIRGSTVVNATHPTGGQHGEEGNEVQDEVSGEKVDGQEDNCEEVFEAEVVVRFSALR
jgi:hypothetical protein